MARWLTQSTHLFACSAQCALTALHCVVCYRYGATLDGSISWSGNTLVLSGVDLSAIDRGAYGTSVWKSSDDGETWTDETADLVTISPGPGVWYDKDFYFVTRACTKHARRACIRGLGIRIDIRAARQRPPRRRHPPPQCCMRTRLWSSAARSCASCVCVDSRCAGGEGVTVKRNFEA
jgi:hypothetical protein